MDSVEFVKNIQDGANLLINYFDSTMALYDLVHKFTGLKLINNCSEAEIRFTVSGKQEQLQEALDFINTYNVSGYGIFSANATMDGDNMIIILTQVR